VSGSSWGRSPDLRSRWHELLPKAPDVGEMLLSRYADHARVYHDLHHLAAVLEAVDLLRDEAADPPTVEMAGWFHDAVYDIGGYDNEAASAELAGRTLAPYLDPETIGEVRRLVLLTRDHAVAEGDRNGAVLCDADLAVLAGSPAAYDEYVRRVRREYAAVPDDAFRVGRARVLRELLALPRLFHTPHGRAHWEVTARANLERELASLT
jgi:predicted metal-dependent HD superfamily phosphohydrolase